ncbi:MAG: hypothetical protein AAF961_07380, partial [Planctomycetota bacterium]
MDDRLQPVITLAAKVAQLAKYVSDNRCTNKVQREPMRNCRFAPARSNHWEVKMRSVVLAILICGAIPTHSAASVHFIDVEEDLLIVPNDSSKAQANRVKWNEFISGQSGGTIYRERPADGSDPEYPVVQFGPGAYHFSGPLYTPKRDGGIMIQGVAGLGGMYRDLGHTADGTEDLGGHPNPTDDRLAGLPAPDRNAHRTRIIVHNCTPGNLTFETASTYHGQPMIFDQGRGTRICDLAIMPWEYVWSGTLNASLSELRSRTAVNVDSAGNDYLGDPSRN